MPNQVSRLETVADLLRQDLLARPLQAAVEQIQLLQQILGSFLVAFHQTLRLNHIFFLEYSKYYVHLRKSKDRDLQHVAIMFVRLHKSNFEKKRKNLHNFLIMK